MPFFQKHVFDASSFGEHLHPDKRARLWTDFLSRVSYNVGNDCHALDGQFNARSETISGKSINIFRMGTSIQKTYRSTAHLKDNDDRIGIYFNLGKTIQTSTQFGREYALPPGEGGILCWEATCHKDAPRGGQIGGLKLPAAVFAEWGLMPADLACRALDCTSPYYRLAQGYALLLVDVGAELDEASAVATTRHLTDLVGMWLGAGRTVREAEDEAATMQARITAIRHLAYKRAFDPGINALAIGRRLGLSERTVRHSLANAGLNLGQLVMQTRLNRAYTMLLDPGFDEMPVSDVAFACGFIDVTSFYRSFRAVFDTTPGSVRERRHLPPLPRPKA